LKLLSISRPPLPLPPLPYIAVGVGNGVGGRPPVTVWQ
jgi:hypothetical protein